MFSQLDKDVIDVIYTALPDLPTLFALTLVARDIRGVFENRPNSIIRAVAYNQLGPALPQALRLVRLNHRSRIRVRCLVEDLPKEDDILRDPITLQEAAILDKNANVAEALEALYSFRHKNIRKKTSQLSPVESLRFQRALYRYWLHCRLFMRCSWDGTGDDGGYQALDQDQDDQEGQKEACITLFDSFSTAELTELFQFWIFMFDTATWAVRAATGASIPSDVDWVVSCGPAGILSCYEACVLPRRRTLTVAQYWNMQNLNLLLVLRERGTARDVNTIKASTKIILTDIEGEFEECDECHRPEGVMLWCSTNWHLLKGRIYRSEIQQSFAPLVFGNFMEMRTLTRQKNREINSIWDIIKEFVQSNTDDWSGGRTLCYYCVFKLSRKYMLDRKFSVLMCASQQLRLRGPYLPQTDGLYPALVATGSRII